jgi:tetratricopeptide (TPR) repeat protein
MPDATKRTASAALVQQAISYLKGSDWAQAEAALTQAMTLVADDADALHLMGIVRDMQGRASDAENYFRRAIGGNPLLPQAHHSLGNLLAAQRRFDEAASEQREAIRLKANFAQAHLALALVQSATGDHESSSRSCAQALRIQPNYLQARLALAAELKALNRFGEAEQALRRALLLHVPDARMAASIEIDLGILLNLQGRFDEALRCFNSARDGAPGMPVADFNLGDTLQRLGRLDESLDAFRRVLEFEPENVGALESAALVAARKHDTKSARLYGGRALALDPRRVMALLAMAIADVEDGDPEAAHDKLRTVLNDPDYSDGAKTTFAVGLAAALDRHGEVRRSFTLYTELNQARRAPVAAQYERARVISEVDRLLEYFRHSGRWDISPIPQPAREIPDGHVFVLGFMRSGTTLLATALAGHRKVVIIDEQEHLTGSAVAFLLGDDGLNQLRDLGEGDIARWQEAYWHSVDAAGLQVKGRVFVDKMPLNTLRLPLIARLFPEAKVIFALRDPRDIVLSCFRRQFDMTPHSFEFLRLDDCARYYAGTMELATEYRNKLPLNIMEVRYENLVSDFACNLRAVCEFVGIDWQQQMLDFSSAADVINPQSASAIQVRRGLYQDAVGQWRRYRDQLAPVLPILQPWIERFGYPAQ